MSLLTPEKVESALSVLKSLNLKDLLAGGMKPGTVKDEGRVSVSDGKKVAGSDQDDLGATSKLSITLRGLASMHAPEKTSILYSSPVDEDQRIQTFCQRLKDAFSEAEMLVKDTGPLLLHATVVNTIYVPGIRGKGSGHGKNRAKLTLDAREILDDYEEFEWMKDVRVEKVALCRMGAQKTEGGEEEYIVEGEVEMP
jgi:activating signal cointegrator complex subunit 1